MPIIAPPMGAGVGNAVDADVVIVGGGFGGLNAAKGLADAPVDVALFDRNFNGRYTDLCKSHRMEGDWLRQLYNALRWTGGEHDVGVDRLVAPVGDVDSGTVVVPACRDLMASSSKPGLGPLALPSPSSSR